MSAWVRQIALSAVDAYQALTRHRPPCCRYLPTCSEYAKDVWQHQALWRAFMLTLGRLLRCHPWGAGGVDCPPAPKSVQTGDCQ